MRTARCTSILYFQGIFLISPNPASKMLCNSLGLASIRDHVREARAVFFFSDARGKMSRKCRFLGISI